MNNKKNIQHEKLKVLWRCWKWFSVSCWGIMREMKYSSLWDSNFSSSMGYAMLRNETVSNKIRGWNITSGFQNFIPFILSKECCIPVNHWNTRVHQCLTGFLWYISCVFLCMHSSAQDFWVQRWTGKNAVFVKLNDNLVSNLQQRKALYVLIIIFPSQHFVN